MDNSLITKLVEIVVFHNALPGQMIVVIELYLTWNNYVQYDYVIGQKLWLLFMNATRNKSKTFTSAQERDIVGDAGNVLQWIELKASSK